MESTTPRKGTFAKTVCQIQKYWTFAKLNILNIFQIQKYCTLCFVKLLKSKLCYFFLIITNIVFLGIMGENTASDDSKITINLLLLGRTQSGKSAAGNTLLGSIDFASHLSPCSVTTSCHLGRSCHISGLIRRLGQELAVQVRVLDTPGYPHSNLNELQVQKAVHSALVQHFGEKGLHLAFLVLRADVPLCKEEDEPSIRLVQVNYIQINLSGNLSYTMG